MAWIKRYADEHHCRLPVLPNDARYGDIWQCDECPKQYVVKMTQFDGNYFEPVKEGQKDVVHKES